MTDAAEIHAALGPVVDAFAVLGVRYCVGGSLASSVHGVPRTSVDVDVLAELSPLHVALLVERLEGRYYLSPERMRDAVQRRRSFNLIHLDTMMKVDVFVAGGRPFDAEALRRARPQAIEGGTSYAVASPEDVLLAKLAWYRDGGETSERQWSDVMGLLKVQGARLEHEYLRRWAAALRVADLLERAVAEGAERG